MVTKDITPTNKVEIFIVGQPKSGTTALASFFDEHPQICMSSPKEPGYFANDLREESDKYHKKSLYFEIRTPRQYESIFKHQKAGQLLGEASTNYLYSKNAAKNIANYNPAAKIIIILRDPVSFLHSLHMQYINETTEIEEDFKTALILESKRKKGDAIPDRVRCPSYLYYRDRAKYTEQIKRYFEAFPKEQITIISNEELRSDTASIYRDMLSFIGVTKNFKPDFKEVNGSKAPRFKSINSMANDPHVKRTIHNTLGPQIYTKLQKNIAKLLLKKSPRRNMDKSLADELKKEFKHEILQLSAATGKDFEAIWGYSDR